MLSEDEVRRLYADCVMQHGDPKVGTSLREMLQWKAAAFAFVLEIAPQQLALDLQAAKVATANARWVHGEGL